MQIKIILLYFLLFPVATFGQNHNKQWHDFVNISDNFNSRDTIRRSFVTKDTKDSIIHITLTNNKDIEYFQVPLYEEVKTAKYTLIAMKEIYYGNKKFIVRKVLFDDENIADDEFILFFDHSIGIFLFKNISWGGHQRIIKSSDNSIMHEIFGLTDKVILDRDFFDPNY